MKMTRLFTAAAALAILAGCQTGGPIGGPVARAPSGVEGDWMSTDGTSLSRFSPGGTFETVATDTGNRLSEGTYEYRDAQTVDILMKSLIRQTTQRVACAQVTPTQLNCTNAAGNQFVLVRGQGVS
ncbi:hypothetical protein [Mesorhizobium xinjiangense]|uniref:hypothetical protein n=1 Tax=Mesorhizobium xinjiangense TaxID=2678685 RepID=UPI0012EDD78B|nr:hypothetical protein [Mesorhizobium xinjiangense]